MKTTIIICLVPLFVLHPLFSNCQENKNAYPGTFYWGEINAGYANHGPMGSAAFNVRKGKLLFGTQYNKSHTCIEDHHSHSKSQSHSHSHDMIDNETHTETHFTVESISLLSGIILSGKCSPSFSIGVSLSRFTYKSTIDIDHNFTVARIWATIINKDYQTERLSSHSINTIGIPAEFKLHFSPKRFIGFDAGIKADFNLHSTTVSAEIGIRFGRIIKKRLN